MAVGFSLAAHLLVLALLAWTTPALRMPVAVWMPDVTVQLQPRRSTSAAAASAPSASALRLHETPATAQVPPSPFVRETRSRRPVEPEPQPQPSPAPPTASRSSPTGAQGGAGAAAPSSSPAAPDRGSDRQGGDVRGAVREAIGCSHEEYLRLNAQERAACERKMAEEPRHAGATVDPIPALKRGAYDRRAAYDERCHRYATPVGRATGDSINRRPSFDEAPPAVRPSGPPPPSPWLFC